MPLSPRDMKDLLAAERQRHNRSVRLAVWVLSHLPYAVAVGISMAFGSEDKQTMFEPRNLLKAAPDYDQPKRRRRR